MTLFDLPELAFGVHNDVFRVHHNDGTLLFELPIDQTNTVIGFEQRGLIVQLIGHPLNKCTHGKMANCSHPVRIYSAETNGTMTIGNDWYNTKNMSISSKSVLLRLLSAVTRYECNKLVGECKAEFARIPSAAV